LQRAIWIPFLNAVSPEGSIRAARVDVVTGIDRDGFDPVQLGRNRERPRRSGEDSTLSAECPDFGRRSIDVVDPNLRVLVPSADQQLAAVVYRE
jgi:hypothetical protein